VRFVLGELGVRVFPVGVRLDTIVQATLVNYTTATAVNQQCTNASNFRGVKVLCSSSCWELSLLLPAVAVHLVYYCQQLLNHLAVAVVPRVDQVISQLSIIWLLSI
jgi:hypothetical protein